VITRHVALSGLTRILTWGLTWAALAGPAVGLADHALLRVGTELPGILDMRDASAGEWVPGDTRDPAQVQAKVEAWSRKVAPLRGRACVRILLPEGPGRIPLLLAASQALRAQEPAVTLYLAFQAGAEPIWDEAAWGAVQGGALLPQDLGPEPAAWRDLLVKAQALLPGRPWTLWLPSDPGARLGQLLGDGGRVVVPVQGPSATLAEGGDAGFTEVEGGLGSLLLRNPRTGEARSWTFAAGGWTRTPAQERHEVQVTAQEAYDVGALLARARARRLRESLALRTQEAELIVNLHVQGGQGPGSDLGFRFRCFQAAGGPEETLQKEVLFNGVKANLTPGLQLPIVESRTSMATPASLTLTERYRYLDGGPQGPGRRLIRFAPVDGDVLLYAGELTVEESSGRILEERSSRSGLPGLVKSETRTLTYGEVAPGAWRLVMAKTFERWVLGAGVTQVQRTLVYEHFLINDPAFGAHRDAAVASDGTMLRATPEGLRYYNKQKDGTRVTEERARSSSRGIGGLLVIDPTLPLPVVPLGGLYLSDFNAFNKGIQYTFLTAVLYNAGSLTIPEVGMGFTLDGSGSLVALPDTERPVQNGQLVNGLAVGRRSGDLNLGLGHDLGGDFHFQGRGEFRYDLFSHPWKDQDWTPGFVLPPSGWNKQLTGELSWLHRGFQLVAYCGEGWRPGGPFGLPGALQAVQPHFTRWGGHTGYDFEVGAGTWLHGEAGYDGGARFDRFDALAVGGTGGNVRVAGIRNNAIAADHLEYVKAAVVVPTGPHLRLTFGLDQGWVRSLDNEKTYAITGLGVAGDLPGFWWFTTVRVDLGVGLLSSLPGVRSFNGFVAFLRVF